MLVAVVPKQHSKGLVDINENDPVYGYVDTDKTAKGGEERDAWLESVRNRENLIQESDRLLRFLAVYYRLRQTNPKQKILVVSQYLKFLDIIAEALKRDSGIDVLRYDTKINHMQRRRVKQEFKECHPSIPLLVTSGASAYGLNVTAASIIIQTKIWWNLTVEWQAICRIWRQLQGLEVLVIQLFASNCPIDCEIGVVQTAKAHVDSDLMEAISRGPYDGPDIRELIFQRYIAPSKYKEYSGI